MCYFLFSFVQHWPADEQNKDLKLDDFTLKANTSGSRAIKEMLDHVETKFKELKELQNTLKIEVKVETASGNNFSNFVKKLTKL